MSESLILQELRLMKFSDYYERCCAGRLTQSEAARLLGMSERTFRRYRGVQLGSLDVTISRSCSKSCATGGSSPQA